MGLTPTYDTRNMIKQCKLAFNEESSLKIAKKMFKYRFPDDNVANKTLHQLMGMQEIRVKRQYEFYAKKYNIDWKYRDANLNKFEDVDITNKYLTVFNQFLYSVLCSSIISIGYSPHIGFIHSGSPLPFVYDMADLYKQNLCIQPSFKLSKLSFDKELAIDQFVSNVNKIDILNVFIKDINNLFGEDE